MEVLVFLHGFLGRPQDWLSILDSHDSKKYCVIIPDYFNIQQISSTVQISEWGNAFVNWLSDEIAKKNLSKDNVKIRLFGYSLGGRLAIQAFLFNPELFNEVNLISTNFGFTKGEALAKKSRMIQDEIWAQKFLNMAWSDVIQEWNQQAVFQNDRSEPVRVDSNYDRKRLALGLINWSLSKQMDCVEEIMKLKPSERKKIHLIVGERDDKYLSFAKSYQERIPEIKYTIVANSGHRVLFDNPESLTLK